MKFNQKFPKIIGILPLWLYLITYLNKKDVPEFPPETSLMQNLIIWLLVFDCLADGGDDVADVVIGDIGAGGEADANFEE